MGLVLAGADPVAVDSVASGIMGISEEELQIEQEHTREVLVN